jgi:hypothetical protein
MKLGSLTSAEAVPHSLETGWEEKENPSREHGVHFPRRASEGGETRSDASTFVQIFRTSVQCTSLETLSHHLNNSLL